MYAGGVSPTVYRVCVFRFDWVMTQRRSKNFDAPVPFTSHCIFASRLTPPCALFLYNRTRHCQIADMLTLTEPVDKPLQYVNNGARHALPFLSCSVDMLFISPCHILWWIPTWCFVWQLKLVPLTQADCTKGVYYFVGYFRAAARCVNLGKLCFTRRRGLPACTLSCGLCEAKGLKASVLYQKCLSDGRIASEAPPFPHACTHTPSWHWIWGCFVRPFL